MANGSRASAAGGLATLVKDIDLSTKSSQARWLTVVNDRAFFRADDGIHGHELWVTDGSEGGTRLVSDFAPGLADSFMYSLTPGPNRLYFIADDGVHGEELWSTDGTDAGMALVKDLRPGPASGAPYLMVAAGDLLYFGFDRKLWRSDGTATGTFALDLGADAHPQRIIAAGDRAFVLARAESGENERSLWVTSGHTANTIMLGSFADVVEPFGVPALVTVHDDVFFVADDRVHGHEPWMSDGTPDGTRLIRDLVRGPEGSDAIPFAALDQWFFFTAPVQNGTRALWRTDGTSANTGLVAEIAPDPNYWSAASGGLLYFTAPNNRRRAELWRTDGTAGGTMRILGTQSTGVSRSPEWPTDLGGTLIFTALDRQSGRELWRSDGSIEGTALIREIRLGDDICASLFPCPSWFVTLDDAVVFAADDGEHGVEIWRTDGTAAGTTLVKDVRPGTNSSSPIGTREHEERLIFSAYDGHERREWISDGTEAGTRRWDAPSQSRSRQCLGTQLGDAFFSLRTGPANEGLWRCDESAGSPTRIRTLSPAGPELVAVGGKLFFRAWIPGRGAELWVSDGSAANTQVLREIRAGPIGGVQYPIEPQLIASGETLYFVADDGVHGAEPWRSDGTAAGTTLLRDLHAGERGSAPQLIGGDEQMLFAADDGEHGRELWSTDGTENGTRMVGDVNPGSAGSWPTEITRVGARILFAAHSDAAGTELWSADGTPTGTHLLRDIKPGSGGSFPSALRAHDGRVFFAANDGAHGWELWSSDGTSAGTVLVHDVDPGARSAYFVAEGSYDEGRIPHPHFDVVGGLLTFVANDTTHGRELWVSDGTDAGTLLVHDVASGSVSADPSNPFAAGPLLFFAADQEATGIELWAAPRSALSPPCVGDCDGDWQVGVANMVAGVRIALGSDELRSCPPFDRDGNANVNVDELLTGVQNALTGCQHLMQRLSPTVAVPSPTATPSLTEPPTPTPSARPDETPGSSPCIVTGCSGEVCASEPTITGCLWRSEYGCLDAAGCEQNSTGCGFVFDRGAGAHRCLIALGRCVFDDDCAVDERCQYQPQQAWGSCQIGAAIGDGIQRRDAKGAKTQRSSRSNSIP